VSLTLGADLDYCRALLVFNVKTGDVEGVDVGGVACAMVVNSPKVMSDGSWKLGLYISDVATDEQAEALGKVFSGDLGGPPAALGPLLGEFAGVERAAMEIHEEGLLHSLKIGDAVDLEVEDIVSFGVETGKPAQLTGIFHPAGDTLTIAKPTHAKVDAFGISYEGKAGFSSPKFSWAG
jgi:hypothetical protein